MSEPRLRGQRIRHWLLVFLIVLIILAALVYVGIKFGWGWTGFFGTDGITTTTTTVRGVSTATQHLPVRTFWDWMQLLLVPLILAAGGVWLNRLQKGRDDRMAAQRTKTEQEAAEKRSQTEREIAENNQREAALQTYIDHLSELMLKHELRKSRKDDEVQKIARVRTLTVLPRLDKERKRSVVQFLYESGLIDKAKSVVDLNQADLSRARLNYLKLSAADLHGADLLKARLDNTDLSNANLSHADLEQAQCHETDLSHANLNDAVLLGSSLIRANLNSANLSNAGLGYANLSNAGLGHANLSGADLTGGIHP